MRHTLVWRSWQKAEETENIPLKCEKQKLVRCSKELSTVNIRNGIWTYSSVNMRIGMEGIADCFYDQKVCSSIVKKS